MALFNLSAVEDAVDVLDELLVVHLAVVEEEDVVGGRLRGLLEDALQRVAPLLHPVLFAHFELEFNDQFHLNDGPDPMGMYHRQVALLVPDVNVLHF